ncbi:MAG: hypothetical protein H6622_04895 [Halobacteriovoraceae bacterium]|nr:hypothetical protein [Halobacteriovoraceae bacterium]
MALFISLNAICEEKDPQCQQYMQIDDNIIKLLNHNNDHKKNLALIRTSLNKGLQVLDERESLTVKTFTLDFVFQNIKSLWSSKSKEEFTVLNEYIVHFMTMVELDYESEYVKKIKKNIITKSSAIEIYNQSLEFETMIYLFLENKTNEFFEYYKKIVEHKHRIRLRKFYFLSIFFERHEFFRGLLEIDINLLKNYNFENGKFVAGMYDFINESLYILTEQERNEIWGNILLNLIIINDIDSFISILERNEQILSVVFVGLGKGLLNNYKISSKYTLLDLCLEKKKEIGNLTDKYLNKEKELKTIKVFISKLRELGAKQVNDLPPSFSDIYKLKHEYIDEAFKYYKSVFLYFLKNKDWNTFFEMASKQTLRTEYPYVFKPNINYNDMLKMIEKYSPIEGSRGLLNTLREDEELPLIPRTFVSDILIEKLKKESFEIQSKLVFQFLVKNDLEQVYHLLKKGHFFSKKILEDHLTKIKYFLWTKSKRGERRGPEVISKLKYIQKINELEIPGHELRQE